MPRKLNQFNLVFINIKHWDEELTWLGDWLCADSLSSLFSSGYYWKICAHLNSLTKRTSISKSGQFMYWEAKSIEDWCKKRVFNADAWTSGCTDEHFFTPPVIIKNWFHPASINTVFGLSVKLSFFGHYFGQETFYACERTQTSFNTFHFLHQAQQSLIIPRLWLGWWQNSTKHWLGQFDGSGHLWLPDPRD